MLLKGCRRVSDHSGRSRERRRVFCNRYVKPLDLIFTNLPQNGLVGLIVLERNYLEVYKYDKWTGKHLPDFEQGQEFMPSVCELRDGETSSPSLLTEADLVTLMDKNGIGMCFVSHKFDSHC